MSANAPIFIGGTLGNPPLSTATAIDRARSPEAHPLPFAGRDSRAEPEW